MGNTGTGSIGMTPRRGAAAAAETLRQITNATGISVWTWNAATDRVHPSHNAVRGAAPEGAPLAAMLARLHTADRARVRRHLKAAARSGKSGAFRFRSAPEGEIVRQYNATHFPLGPDEVQVIVEDVTRTTAAEQALRESEDHYRTAVDLNPEVLWLADPDGSIIEFGPRWLEMVELNREQTLGQGWANALHPDDLAPTIAEWTRSLQSGAPLDVTYRVRLRTGDYRWMRARAQARRDKLGRIVRWYGTLEDIHDRRVAEAALRESEAFARSILEASTMAIEVLDVAGHLIFMNGPGIRIMEVDDFEAIKGLPFDAFWPEDERPAIRTAIAAAQRGETVRLTVFGPTAKGLPRWWDLSLSPIRDGDGEVARLLALSRDVTEAKQNEAEVAAGARRLDYLARHDALTGLPNRMHFQESMDAALLGLDPLRPLAVLSIDLDDFKLVNDTLGHLAGDALLRQVAGRLNGCITARDLLARLGGDEFALLVPVTEPQEAAETAQAILAALTEPFEIEGETVSIGASIGIAMAPRDGASAESLLQYADVALYRVKGEKGRDFRFFEPAMDQALRERREMKRELSLALGRGELSVVYQPQIDIASNRLTGFEALLRWDSATHGSVPPMVFIPLAEESGLIETIGAFVLQQACAAAAGWPEALSLAVNLSPAQFRHRAVVRTVTDALERTGLAPHRLELEITESVLFDENVEALAALQQLHQLGIRVALDDFGTGYSSLSYLRRFAFDKIKIDRSFVSDLPGAEDSAAIVRAIIGLGRSLKTRVTAEGVETWEQLLMLRAEGCNEAQGYLFSRPLPQAEAQAFAEAGPLARPQADGSRQRHA
ncbi:sensor domain-containing protein [Devosia sp. A16]|uniref:sensor domain-containing protein n=1 Tax=Devosia sp. A16 TaxID=1736675 RepID=UPI0006D7828E|nr:EAL domain-containing protein [Devosia sp. A16]